MRFQERREDNKQTGPFLTRVQENNKMYKERFRDHISPYCGTPETGGSWCQNKGSIIQTDEKKNLHSEDGEPFEFSTQFSCN